MGVNCAGSHRDGNQGVKGEQAGNLSDLDIYRSRLKLVLMRRAVFYASNSPASKGRQQSFRLSP